MSDIKCEVLNEVGWIIINRPDVRNAARPQTMREICEAIDAFSSDPNVGGLVIFGHGGHFLAGADFNFLGDLARSAVDGYSEVYAYYQGAARRLFDCAKPTVAAISGAAITVGCELSLACDIRVADNTAFFEEAWLRLGLIPPLGGAMLLPRIIGLARAKEMILQAKRVRAAEALEIGLVSHVCEPHHLRDEAQSRVLNMMAFPRQAFAFAKAALHRGLESSMRTEWQANVLAQGILLKSSEFRERVDGLALKPRDDSP